MNPSKFLTIHGQDPKAWSAHWGLTPKESSCKGCGKPIKTTIPFAYSRYRGLKAPQCSCGDRSVFYCLVVDPKHGDLFNTGAKA